MIYKRYPISVIDSRDQSKYLDRPVKNIVVYIKFQTEEKYINKINTPQNSSLEFDSFPRLK